MPSTLEVHYNGILRSNFDSQELEWPVAHGGSLDPDYRLHQALFIVRLFLFESIAQTFIKHAIFSRRKFGSVFENARFGSPLANLLSCP